jgi:hypothetical protein
MSGTTEVLVYPRFVETPRGARVDNSSVIARFMVGQEFTDRTSADRKVHRITRIDRDGIWGVECEPETVMEPSK